MRAQMAKAGLSDTSLLPAERALPALLIKLQVEVGVRRSTPTSTCSLPLWRAR